MVNQKRLDRPKSVFVPPLLPGLRLKMGNVHVCAYSVSSADFVAADPVTQGYPASTNRSCCTVGEYLFHNAIESDRKANADILRMSTQAVLGVVNVATAFFAYFFWADWRRSSAWASTGWLFPFFWIFVINAMPFSKLATPSGTFNSLYPPHHAGRGSNSRRVPK